MRIRVRTLIALLAAFTLTLAACGGGEEDDNDTGTPGNDTGQVTDTGTGDQDTGGGDMDTGGGDLDTGGADEDTGGAGEDTGGGDQDTGGAGEDTGSGDMDGGSADTGGVDMDTGGGDMDGGSADTGTTDGGTQDGGAADTGMNDGGAQDGGMAMTSTIQQLKQTASSIRDENNSGGTLSKPYEVTGVVVTGVGSNGFYVQEQSGNAANSGIWVYAGNNPSSLPAEGDVLTINGTVMNYYGLIEFDEPTVQKTGTASVPAPVLVTVDEIATGGTKSVDYRGVLVKVETVEVTELKPKDSQGKRLNNTQFAVKAQSAGSGASELYVDDELFSGLGQPTLGDKYTSLVGVLDFNFNETKLTPRGSTDVTK